MPTERDEPSPGKPKKKRSRRSAVNIEQIPLPLTPTQRLDAMTRDRIDALEADKSTLDERLESARDNIRQQSRDNASLREQNAVLMARLADQGAWDVLATLLVGGGGLLLGAAAYLPGIGVTAGLFGFGLFAAGLLMQAVRLFKKFETLNLRGQTCRILTTW